MEPLFFKAENVSVFQDVNLVAPASMEPLFFKAENKPWAQPCVSGRVLQWSRFFSKRKIYDRQWTAF